MSKPIKILLVILGILIVAAAVAAAYWFGQKNRSSSKLDNVPKAWTDQAEVKTTGAGGANQINPQQLAYETYATADSQLSLKYPKDWIKSEIGDPSSIISKEIVDKYKIKFPLLVSLTSADKLTQISLMYYEFKAGQTPAQVITELLEAAKTQETTVETLDQENNAAVSVIESKYTVKDLKLRVKEKLLFLPTDGTKQPAYIVSLSVLEKDWQNYTAVANFVLDSAKLTKAGGTDIPASSVGTATQAANVTTDAGSGVNSNFSEIFIGKIAKTADSKSTSISVTDRFDLSQDQFCLFDKTTNAITDINGLITNSQTNESTYLSINTPLNQGEFKNCQILTLSSGNYQLKIVVNKVEDKSFTFSVK